LLHCSDSESTRDCHAEPKGGTHAVDRDWLENLPAAQETLGIRHVVLPHPLTVHLDGARGQGLILRGAAG